MDFSGASSSLIRLTEEGAAEQQPLPKRPRLSSPSPPRQLAPTTSYCTDALQSMSGVERDDEWPGDDSLCTPERELEPEQQDAAPDVAAAAAAAAAAVEDQIQTAASFTSPSIPQSLPLFGGHSYSINLGRSNIVTVDAPASDETHTIGAASRSGDASPSRSKSPIRREDRLPELSIGTTNLPQVANENALPQFPSVQRGKSAGRWPAECDAALVRYAAQDSVVRNWAVKNCGNFNAQQVGEDASGYLIDSLQRFSDLTRGPAARNVYQKIVRWRELFEGFNNSLTSTGRSTPIDSWTDANDLQKLAEVEKKGRKGWMKLWHQELHLPSRIAAHAQVSTTGPSSNVMAEAAPAVSSGSSNHTASAAGPSSSGLGQYPPSQTPFPSFSFFPSPASAPGAQGIGHFFASSGQPSFATCSSTLPKRKIRIKINKRSADARLEAQRTVEIASLQAQNQVQSQLIARQSELLLSHSIQSGQPQMQINELAESVEQLKQQLESLHALLRERT